MQSKKSWLKPLKSVFLFFTLAEPFWEELVKLKRRCFFNRNPKKRIQYISKNWSMKGVLVLRKIKDAFFRLYRCKGVKVYKFWKFWTQNMLYFLLSWRRECVSGTYSTLLCSCLVWAKEKLTRKSCHNQFWFFLQKCQREWERRRVSKNSSQWSSRLF